MWGPYLLTPLRWHIDEPPTNDIDKQLATFCGIDHTCTIENNPYFEFWERLSLLIVRKPNESFLRMYVAVIGSMSLHLVSLFEKQDVKALMLYVHWARLMCEIETWWSARRMKSTCWAACHMLSSKVKMTDLRLLMLPAEACGVYFGLSMEHISDV
ncbi:hypothetical protein P280DRAFT_388833 [Massarina eburnea CBS 473.64]|uniref:Uncharacterized protein n=1 Tax=Massarina eburnea CBS 473.64 TaxID=1395130 RepID=A0A6A6SID3_9PLEO|nr:hypothetical protein P280DRAFT_388833 [Massarina eburnea CBS 473.64]